MKKKKIKSELEKTTKKLQKAKSQLKSVTEELKVMQSRLQEISRLESTMKHGVGTSGDLPNSISSNDGDLHASSATN